MDRHRVASRWPRRRLQVNASPSWIEVLGSPTTALSILAMSTGGHEAHGAAQATAFKLIAHDAELSALKFALHVK
jgi:hypothetical protein